ncbi:helix-turn-helix domain-containing protein [Maribacter sp. IgM3_T14_3]|uniref:helix-turn-helix domain-containing protein n=1 Tax=Maribacter sp. IgM3_T14_3 TaxID=3415140 RepID=UPI003C7047B8
MFKYVQSQMEMDTPDKWIDKKEAKRLLRIKSDTTLQKLRDEGQIRYSQPEKKHIVYDRDSLIEYLENHVRETF